MNHTLSIKEIFKSIVTIAIIGAAVYILLPKLGELQAGVTILKDGNWWYFALAFTVSLFTFLTEAWMARASIDTPLPWIKTVLVEIVAIFASTITPGGLGWLAINQKYLAKECNDNSQVQSAVAVILFYTILSHLALLFILLLFIPAIKVPQYQPPEKIIIGLVIIVVLIAAVFILTPRFRRKAFSETIRIMKRFSITATNPVRSVILFSSGIATNVFFGLTLYICIAEFGSPPSFLGTLLAYMIASTIGSISPTPGGIGAMEITMLALITRLGIPPDISFASVMAFRLITFWVVIPLGGLMFIYFKRKGLL